MYNDSCWIKITKDKEHDRLYSIWNVSVIEHGDIYYTLVDENNNPFKNLVGKNYELQTSTHILNTNPIFKTKEIIW